MNNSLVSVIIPSFNRENLICETLESVLSQTYCNWECIIVDDGSTDSTIAIIKNYLEKDNRFSLYKRPSNYTKGPSSCRNIGLEKAKGNYVIFLDSDDLLASFCLEDRCAAFAIYSTADFLVFGMKTFDKEIPLLKSEQLSIQKKEDWLTNFMALRGSWQTTAPMYKRSFIFGIKGFSEEIVVFEDFEVALRALFKSTNNEIFRNVDYYYRNDESYFKKHIDLAYEKKTVDAFVKFLRIMNENIVSKTKKSQLQRKYKANCVEAYRTIFQRYIIPNVIVFKKENKEMTAFFYENKYIDEIKYFKFLVVHHILFKFHRIKGLGLYRLINVLMK